MTMSSGHSLYQLYQGDASSWAHQLQQQCCTPVGQERAYEALFPIRDMRACSSESYVMNTHKFCNTSLAMPPRRQLFDVDRGDCLVCVCVSVCFNCWVAWLCVRGFVQSLESLKKFCEHWRAFSRSGKSIEKGTWVEKMGFSKMVTCTHPRHTFIFKRPTKEISSAKINQKYQEDVFTTQSTCWLYLGWSKRLMSETGCTSKPMCVSRWHFQVKVICATPVTWVCGRDGI